ncbi:MAG: hypothetical protein BAJALOKI1v1_80026 [Promethearchaeota archaeon]|nr:MAG: hypothetical protein BAJALOKI1v1_80026 [Candidatus Lokiarchaeota archaeon]
MRKRNSLISSKKWKKKGNKLFIGVVLIFLISMNIISISSNLLSSSDSSSYLPPLKGDSTQENIINSQGIDISLLQDPYTVNFTDIWDFFETNYISGFDFDVDIYFREGDENGTITSDLIYSLDNILLYNSLLKNEYDSSQILTIYDDLQDTFLWYNGPGSDLTEFDYGFVASIDNSTEDVNDYQRNLLDNLMPIFLLLDHMPSTPSSSYLSNIEQAFTLINSSEFWQESTDHFLSHNSSSGNVYAIDNLYGILATLSLNQTDQMNSQVRIDAGQLANKTMEMITAKFWDSPDNGYIHSLTSDLTSVADSNKYLETNAIGILTLVEYWKYLNQTEYLTNATALFNTINTTLWNNTYGEGAYVNQSANDWTSPNNIIDIKANALMMEACLTLFEVSGNISYYDTAINLYNTFETIFYNSTIHAYASSLDTSSGTKNEDKNLLYNLYLSEAYLAALEVYENSSISATFNNSEQIPQFIFDQDNLTVISTYAYNSSYINHSISNADLTYTIRYPNETIVTSLTNTTNENGTHILSYPLSSGLLIADYYTITIFANKSFFKYATTIMLFNVSSGIEYVSGLEDENEYNQGVSVNITLVLNNTRDTNVNVNFSIEAGGTLITSPRPYLLNSSEDSITLWNNFTVKNDAVAGNYTFHFILKNGTDIYLDLTRIIEIKASIVVTQLVYEGRIVKGDTTEISFNIANFLQNQSTSFNLSITGDHITSYAAEINIAPNEIKSLNINLKVDDAIIDQDIQIRVLVYRGNITYFNTTITPQIINKFEIASFYYPSTTTQGASAQFLVSILNNKNTNELYMVAVNGEMTAGLLVPGDNRVAIDLEPILNPYDISTKMYQIVIFDNTFTEVFRFYFSSEIRISTMNFVVFYILPIIIPIAIVVYFKNKQLKTDRLKR